MSLSQQIIWLFLLAIPIACISWTVTHEEVFREPRMFFTQKSLQSKTVIARKFFYLFTCEYCFSHYVAILFIFLTGFKLLESDWSGYLISGFSLVWIANIYMCIFGFIRQDIKMEQTEINLLTKKPDY